MDNEECCSQSPKIENVKPIFLEETERTYKFPNGQFVHLTDVTELIVRGSGTHRLKTKDGRMHIVPKGWLQISIVSPEDWVA